MQNLAPKSLLDRLCSAALSLLAAAVTAYLAIRLIEAIWVPLLVVGAVLLAAAVFRVWRRKNHGW